MIDGQEPPENLDDAIHNNQSPPGEHQVPEEGSPSLLPIPHETLYFPPSMSAFLGPYLPPRNATDGLPHVTLTYATSMDSFLTLSPLTSTPISGPVTKAMCHYLRSCHDTIIIGVSTAIVDDPTLNCRLAENGGYHPQPCIIDPKGRWQISDQSRILKAVKEGRGHAPWLLISPGIAIAQDRIELLETHGGKYISVPDSDDNHRFSWESIFRTLADLGVRSVLVEGGGVIINELLEPKNIWLVKNAIVTIAPTYFGGNGGASVSPSRRVNSQGNPVPAVRFRDVRWQGRGEDVVMAGRLSDTSAITGNTTGH